MRRIQAVSILILTNFLSLSGNIEKKKIIICALWYLSYKCIEDFAGNRLTTVKKGS